MANNMVFLGSLNPLEEADLEVREPPRNREGEVETPSFVEFSKKEIAPFPNHDEKLYIGGGLLEEVNRQIEDLLAQSRDIFAWTPKDLKEYLHIS